MTTQLLADDVPRCPKCGYTNEDCLIHWDHRLCGEADPHPAPEPQGVVDDGFNGDNTKLIGCARALLSLDASNSLVPHGIGGHARSLLQAFVARLPVSAPQGATTETRVTDEAVNLMCAAFNGSGDNPSPWKYCGPPDEFSKCIRAAITAALPHLTAQPDEPVAAVDALKRIRLRAMFMGMPQESYWQRDDKWIPDWRYELQLIENVLFGTPIRAPEKPTDTQPHYAIAALRQQPVTLREVTIDDAIRFSLPLATLREILPHGLPVTGSEGERG